MELGHSFLNVSMLRAHPNANVSIDVLLNYSRRKSTRHNSPIRQRDRDF